ncbi:hypothetical protein F5146DRAFT_1186011 [Armillaria mellea]|nr:hypothetical protein F5146DRAFT_1186011 [Armillaria mellea]
MPTVHDDDDSHAFWGIDGGVKGATITPPIIVIRQSAEHQYGRSPSHAAILGSPYSRSIELIALLSTNAISTAFQAAQPKASFIEVLDDPIAEIQNEIDQLRNAAASLKTKMKRLKVIRRDYRAALSPVRRLPTGIIEILRWTSKEKTETKEPGPYRIFGFNVSEIGAGSWYLGQVCSSWRDAVWFLATGDHLAV